MTGFDPGRVRVLAFDIFGTTVDWYTGVAGQLGELFAEQRVEVDAGEFASAWRDRYVPSMQRVQAGERTWAYLDTLHRESLDDLLGERGLADRVDEAARSRAVRAWHRLPAWGDTVPGLSRLRERYVLAALSNSGFAALTYLVKAAGLPFDCILSAELARAYKPDPRVYRTAAALLDVEPGQGADGRRARRGPGRRPRRRTAHRLRRTASRERSTSHGRPAGRRRQRRGRDQLHAPGRPARLLTSHSRAERAGLVRVSPGQSGSVRVEVDADGQTPVPLRHWRPIFSRTFGSACRLHT